MDWVQVQATPLAAAVVLPRADGADVLHHIGQFILAQQTAERGHIVLIAQWHVIERTYASSATIVEPSESWTGCPNSPCRFGARQPGRGT